MNFMIGDVVSAAHIEHWKPTGVMVVVSVKTGKRAGMSIVTAKDKTGKTFTGFYGAFDLIRRGQS